MITTKGLVLIATGIIIIGNEAAIAQQKLPEGTLENIHTRGSASYQGAVSSFLSRETPKIVGGAVAVDGAYPWQVSLSVSWIADPMAGHFCGGSIYNMNWIVTAAHCVVGNQPQDIHVVSGTNKLAPGVFRTNVRRIIVHRAYNKPMQNDNDIALLELFEPLVPSDRTKSIELLSTADEDQLAGPGKSLTVTGWGATQEGGTAVLDLRFVVVPSVSRTMCNQPPSYNGRITESMICAGNPVGGKDSCQGDSGGPLITDKNLGPVKLAGIVSWGEGCAEVGKFGVYTRVARYNQWVAKCTSNPEGC